MTTTLFNPTTQSFLELYCGRDYRIAPNGEKGNIIHVDDATGKHLLNKLSARGLMELKYGDESRKDEIASAGIRQCEKFWLRQIEVYNQDNESRKAGGKPYVQPKEEVVEWSKKLGVGLIKPYSVADVKNENEARLKSENDGLRKEIDELKDMFKAFMASQQTATPIKTPEEKHDEDVRNEAQTYKMMTKAEFIPWMEQNIEFYQKAFPENQEDMRKKWDKMSDNPFPY